MTGPLWLALVILGVAGEAPPLPALALAQFPDGVRERIAAADSRARQVPPSASAAGELGMLLHAYDQLSSAASAYERARALDPSAFEWSYLGGLVRLRSGQPGDAVPRLREAVERRPESLAARVRLGEALAASGETEAARRLYLELVQRYPDAPQARYGMGRVEGASGNKAAAAEQYLAATQLYPAYGAAHYALGLVLRDLGRREDAERHLQIYRQHLMEAPPLADPALERVLGMKQGGDAVLAEAVRRRDAGDVEGSIREHLRALELDPTLAKAHANLMALYGQGQEWALVDAHYQKAVSLAPGLVEAHYNHALALQQQKRTAEAEAALGRVLELSPHHALAQNALGAIYELAGKPEQAADMYRRAAANQADFRAARFNLGRVLVDLGRPGDAAREFAQLLAPEDEQSALYLYALAVAEARAGDRQAALGHAQGAIRKAQERGQRELVELASGFERELRLSLAKEPR